ncbi:MAG TPA: sigma-70 family RNA polymerase sigma factor [Puia sp.]|nr:sigma-70 family RNA polymerase sigma factor [Puia sp.]
MSLLKNISSSTADDQELIARYKQSGDLKTLGDLYQRYMELVFGACLKYLKDEEKAKDATMSIFEELIIKAKRYEIKNFKSWLYTLSKNYCLMQLRSPKYLSLKDLDIERMQLTEEVHLNGVFDKEDQLNQVQDCLETLVPEQKTTVSLFYLENKCYKEISEITGLDWNKIRSQIQNGRRNLKICMEAKFIIDRS